MAHILICEDDEAVRSFAARALQLDGHEITTAFDGQDGLETLQTHDGNFDLLLSDVKMPIMDGITLAKEAARRWPHLPVMLMTGYADQRERARDLDQIIEQVILKPFSLSDLRQSVEKIVANKAFCNGMIENTPALASFSNDVTAGEKARAL